MKDDEEIIARAKDRFKECEDFEADFRKLFVDDLKFCNADSDNKYQWPDALSKSRELDSRPCLTINKTRQHALMIQNEIKQNMPSVQISATGGDASNDSAKVFDGLVRYIEYNSNASDAYDSAMMNQVQGGLGYWRVTTDYQNDDSFDQEIFIQRIENPLSVYIDRGKQSDGSDSRYGFIFEDMPRDDFERKYPQYKEISTNASFGKGDNWCSKDQVRVCEYYECTYKSDKLVAIPVRDQMDRPTGQFDTFLLSTVPQELRKALLEQEDVQARKVETKNWKWYLICGKEIVDRKDWPGKYLPIVQVVGEEAIIDGSLDRKGHVRNLKDPQRMYNYWTSSAVEQVALQGKQPYIASKEAINGYEDYYANANRVNYSYLPYNGLNEQGEPVTPPQREQPPQMAPAYINGMQIAAEEMKMVSGQADPTMGMQANETAGIAIKRRIKQGETATFHYIDNLSKAVRYTGKILVDLIPKIYDTPRIIRILAEDGTDEQIKIDPQQKESLTTQSETEDNAQRIFNPGVGKYDVVAESGPSYATRREEAAEAMQAIAVQNPNFMGVAGDLFFRCQDFPMAEELAERYSRTIPDALKGTGPTPEMQQMQQQSDQLQGQLKQAQDQLAATIKALADQQKTFEQKEKDLEIKSYDVMTTRMDKFLAHLGNIPGMEALGIQTIEQSFGDPSPMSQPDTEQLNQVPQDPQPMQQMAPPMGTPPMQ